jgi:hypothetical protein
MGKQFNYAARNNLYLCFASNWNLRKMNLLKLLQRPS